jgi:hypothetical protein
MTKKCLDYATEITQKLYKQNDLKGLVKCGIKITAFQKRQAQSTLPNMWAGSGGLEGDGEGWGSHSLRARPVWAKAKTAILQDWFQIKAQSPSAPAA